MAIQRIDGYVYSCAGCGLVYPRRHRRDHALQDELDHHRAVEEEVCGCPLIGEHQHHRTDCAWSHQLRVEAPSEPFSPGATT